MPTIYCMALGVLATPMALFVTNPQQFLSRRPMGHVDERHGRNVTPVGTTTRSSACRTVITIRRAAHESKMLDSYNPGMALVVFLRGANVRGHRTFLPSILTSQLS